MNGSFRLGPATDSVPRFCLALLAAMLLACTSSRAAPLPTGDGLEVSVLRYQGSTGNVTFPELAEDLGYFGELRLEYVGNTISGPQDIQTVVTRDTDFGAAFNGAIVNLVAAGAPIRSVIGAFSIDERTWNGFYVLESSPIRSARDFIGKKVAMNTLGAHSQFMLEEYLYRNGVNKAEVQQVTMVVIPPVNAELALRQGQVDVAVLGNLFRDKALERGGIRAVFSDYDLFGAITSASYVLSNDFIVTRPNAARRFVEGTARALEWSRETPEGEVIARLRRIINDRKRNEDDGAIRYWKSTRGATRGGVIDAREFQTWVAWLERDGQLQPGRVETSALYTNQFNPFAASASVRVLRAGAPPL
jgi:ABC-type nitrate/sulfonate/bicarbonate transport system substrate-binding protein